MHTYLKSTLLAALLTAVTACGSQKVYVGTPSGEETVNVGYGELPRKNVTTAVSKVEVEGNIIGSYRNIFEYLEGRVPGVYIDNTKNPPVVRIRGINTIYASAEPLYVVDGMVVADITTVNPMPSTTKVVPAKVAILSCIL